jgi:nitrite reductase/ring-hydroxylating ferredoxin subunit
MQVPTSGIFFTALGSQEIMLSRDKAGNIVAHSGFCTHSMGRLEGGRVEGDEITCPHHGARFNFRTGRAMTACPNLPKFEVKIEGRRVLVRLPR